MWMGCLMWVQSYTRGRRTTARWTAPQVRALQWPPCLPPWPGPPVPSGLPELTMRRVPKTDTGPGAMCFGASHECCFCHAV